MIKVLSGQEIEKCVKDKSIQIQPFNKEQLNPNSYNLRLADVLMVYKDVEGGILDMKKITQ